MSLKDFLVSKQQYSQEHIRQIIRQLLEGLSTVHGAGLIHRDVKPGNIIVDTVNFDSRLVDFGLAEFYFPGKEYNIRIATKPYKPPEILIQYRKYFQSFDMWGVGNVLGCLVARATALTEDVPQNPFDFGEGLGRAADAHTASLRLSPADQVCSKGAV